MRKILRSLACVVTAVVLSAAAGCQSGSDAESTAGGTPAHIRQAVESADRTAEARARDAARKPAEVLTLAGVEPGDRIVEFAGFGNYYTDMLAAAVGPEGEVHMFDLPYTEQRAGEGSRAFVASHPNTTYNIIDYNEAQLPQGVDVVFNVLYYHDLAPNDVDTAALNRKIFAALRSGGRFVVIDHKAEDGSGWRDAATIHRMGAATIRQEVLAAGFELQAESDLLANPDDDRSQMVFSPGTRGATDRVLFVFVKP